VHEAADAVAADADVMRALTESGVQVALALGAAGLP
jgi:hypothetical protein